MVQNAGLGVGALLRQRREELGQDVEAVARQLRIRPIYITAIEDGRLQDLPGTAYAVGFVRTYADFLGFDGNSVVANYRDELAQRSRTEPVTWRMEERESHFPGGKLLIACVLLAGLGYGAWYYLSNTQSGVGLIEAVPEYLKKGGSAANGGSKGDETAKAPEAAATSTGEMTAKPSTDLAAPAPAGGEATATVSAPQGATTGETPPATAPATDAAATSTTNSTGQTTTGQTTAATPPSTTATVAPAGAGQPGSGQAGTTATLAPATETPATGTQSTAASQPATLQPSATAQQTGMAASTSTTASPQAPAASQAEGSEAAPEVAAAAAASTTRISIRAKLESWVQILDKDGKPILSRVLRAGETYAVPDEKGLIMSTGNAGGIEMVLDGKPLQSLGSVGLVRRNITLDPEKLASGAAFLKTPTPVAPSSGGGANTGD